MKKFKNARAMVKITYYVDVDLGDEEFESECDMERALEEQAENEIWSGSKPFVDEANIENIEFDEIQEE